MRPLNDANFDSNVGLPKKPNAFVYRFRNDQGQSLIEIIVALAIGGIVSLGVATVFTFAIQQFTLMIDQNEAEGNLLQAAYYFRSFVGQAVKTNCCRGANCVGGGAMSTIPNAPAPAPILGLDPAYQSSVGEVPPVGVPRGFLDCRTGTYGNPNVTMLGSPAAGLHTLGLFIRESGINATTSYMATGIYFDTNNPARWNGDAGAPGSLKGNVLHFSSSPIGGVVSSTNNSIKFDHIVDVSVVNVQTSAFTTAGGVNEQIVQSITYRIRARYHKSVTGTRDWGNYDNSNPPAGSAIFRDISMDVTVGLRDNWLGISLAGTGLPERLNGSLYYFKLVAPPLNTF